MCLDFIRIHKMLVEYIVREILTRTLTFGYKDLPPFRNCQSRGRAGPSSGSIDGYRASVPHSTEAPFGVTLVIMIDRYCI